MTRVNNILRISELKWTGMGEFNSDDHYIYYYGQESLRRNGVALMKWSEFGQSCPTLCNPMDCIPPGSSIHGIFQAGVLEWIAISFSSWSSWSGYQTQVSHISGRRFTIWATREARSPHSQQKSPKCTNWMQCQKQQNDLLFDFKANHSISQ